jgi:hypothetical protein
MTAVPVNTAAIAGKSVVRSVVKAASVKRVAAINYVTAGQIFGGIRFSSIEQAKLSCVVWPAVLADAAAITANAVTQDAVRNPDVLKAAAMLSARAVTHSVVSNAAIAVMRMSVMRQFAAHVAITVAGRTVNV